MFFPNMATELVAGVARAIKKVLEMDIDGADYLIREEITFGEELDFEKETILVSKRFLEGEIEGTVPFRVS
jgi:hypothetical protein